MSKFVMAVILAVTIPSVVISHQRLEAIVGDNAMVKNWLPSYDVVKLVSLGHERLLADIFWLLFVQYCGDPEVTKQAKYELAYDYANLVTQLDPQFSKPYWFGCWTIGYWQKRPDLADKILQRGISYNPKEWYMPFMAGVNQYIFANDDQKAAKYYERAAELPGAPNFLKRQAAILNANIPAFTKKVKTLRNVLEHTTDEDLKAQITAQLVAIWERVYITAPTDQIRKKAASELEVLGVTPRLLSR